MKEELILFLSRTLTVLATVSVSRREVLVRVVQGRRGQGLQL